MTYRPKPQFVPSDAPGGRSPLFRRIALKTYFVKARHTDSDREASEMASVPHFFSWFFRLVWMWLALGKVTFAKEIINDVTQLNPIEVSEVASPSSIEEISQLVKKHDGPISIGGGRYSQGGQIAAPSCLFIDMRKLDRIKSIDLKNKRITVEAGITWRKIQEAIDPQNLSVKIMQSYSNFTVGGSLSVNVHGRYVGEGPIIRSVESIEIVLADGSIRRASPTKNSELFFSAIGGYGGIGVIVEATLQLAQNTPLERVAKKMPLTEYPGYFKSNVSSATDAVLHNADLYPPKFNNVNAVTWKTTDLPVTITDRLAPVKKLNAFELFQLSWIADGPWGKTLREYLYDPYLYSDRRVEWRNFEASQDVASLEPKSRTDSTYVLQEYFLSPKKLLTFVPKMKEIFGRYKVNVLNVSIRHALPDPGSYLAWAPKEVFALVIYYKQNTDPEAKATVKKWTQELINTVLSVEGTYYLPYQIHATEKQFFQAYPRAREFFAIKRKVDPRTKFTNRLWDTYFKAN